MLVRVITFLANEFDANALTPILQAEHPGTILPGRVVAHMSSMAAFEISYPMILAILVEADYRPFPIAVISQRGCTRLSSPCRDGPGRHKKAPALWGLKQVG